ncbi:MAG: hypothetical protein D6682_04550 [Zetaproteobacteria bacterium]|nr:MAG: hypothetical protein D6682_04550 [Zetaproteobacteria bacterium]
MLPSPILTLCSANICRSPFAEHYLRHRLRQAGAFAEVFSRGILEMEGRPVPEEGLAAAREMGVEMGRHRSCRVQAGDLDRAALVLVMEQQHRHYLMQLRPQCVGKIFLLSQPGGGGDVPDPMGKGLEAFRDSYRVIAQHLDGWLLRFGVVQSS